MPNEGLARNGLHLAGLSSFAIAQQYFEPLADGPDFLIERGAAPLDVVWFALGMVVLPPLILLALEALAGLLRERARAGVHLVFVAALVGLIAWQAVTEADPGVRPLLAYAIGAAVGAGAAVAYARAEVVRSFATVLGIAPVVVLSLFLFASPVRSFAFGGGGSTPQKVETNETSVVLVVLDELPTASLMDARGRIDARRLPGFAALARDSTWYRNAASPADYTQLAVPAILTGRHPNAEALQVASEHPDNLFTLLGASHRLDVFEALTDICRTACPRQEREPFQRRIRGLTAATIRRVPALPPRLSSRLSDAIDVEGPPEGAARRPAIAGDVRRVLTTTQDVRFQRFLQTLPAGREPTLNYLHLVLPHRPWVYLPDGRRYNGDAALDRNEFGRWPTDPTVASSAWQRHLLQTGFVDRLLSRLIAKLKANGTFDRTLLVVVADHGAAFRAGDESRVVTQRNIGEIAPVPMLVKAPRQRRGAIDDSDVETTDVLPTIARHLDARVPWRTDGVAAQTHPRRRTLTVLRQEDGAELRIDRGRLERLREAAVRRRLRVLRNGPFELGPALAGRAAKGVRRAPGARAVLDSPARYAAIDPGARVLPVNVAGTVEGGRARGRPVAVAVNGVIVATGRSAVIGGRERFAILTPPSALRPGRNRVEALLPR